MHAELVAIIKLSEVDAERDLVARELGALEAARKQAAAAEASATAALEAARATLAAAVGAEQEANVRLSEHKHRQEQAKRALAGQFGSAAAEKQLEQSLALADQDETAILDAMMRQDAARGSVKEADRALQGARAVRADLEAGAAEQTKRLAARLAVADAARIPAAAALGKDLLHRYEGVYKKRKTAVARVVDGCCAACQMVVAAQHLSDLKRGVTTDPCRGCGRWLIP
jgi:predicted  nucleic acid-binding Zn-ribbon protein